MADKNDVAGSADELYRSGSTSGQDNSADFKAILESLRSIDDSIKKLLKDGPENASQSSARDKYKDKTDAANRASNFSRKTVRNTFRKNSGGFTDELEDALLKGILGSDFDKNVGEVLKNFANDLGVSVEDLPSEFGKQLGNMAMDAFKGTSIGKGITNKVQSSLNNLAQKAAAGFKSGAGTEYTGGTADAIGNLFRTAASKSSSATAANAGSTTAASGTADTLISLASSASSTDAAMKGALTAVKALTPSVLASAAAMIALDFVLGQVTEVLSRFGDLLDAAGAAANRDNRTRQAMLDKSIERVTADINTMISAPFEILEKAAEKIYEAWDSNLRLINATQGYSKSDLQDLMSVYAQRLRNENLSSVIGGTDVIQSLSDVLKSGLSGRVAEEFAYQATLLNAAVPTQDFFSYAETYASLAANQIRLGASEEKAIEYANEQLELFASNVLYASRQLSGGFSTGLKDAESLFEAANKIAQSSRTGNPSEIAGVLTSVAAITGAIAPDLSTSMTDAIIQAATGGNNSELVALRSLAGINASNTEFLRQLAENPKGVFTTLFENLADLQNMSSDAYMEVAEGLSSIFGLSMDAFARIDFNYLAQAISSMNVSNASLEENLAQLISGETTTTAEQLRMQQINEYMIDEGLAYVLDNEVARSIQEHMWDEQLANELMEATYGVEIKGAALQFLEGLRQAVDNIISIINPFSWVKKIVNVATSVSESNALGDDVGSLLELGKVGQGNANSYYQLTTRGVDLNLTSDIISLMGGASKYSSVSQSRHELLDTIDKIAFFLPGGLLNTFQTFIDGRETPSNSSISSNVSATRPTSVYSWGSISKSVASTLQSGIVPTPVVVSTPSGASVSASSSDAASKLLAENFAKMTDEEYIRSFIDEGKGYDEWRASASQFGIADFDKAIEELGYTEDTLQNYFQSQSAAAYQEREIARQAAEEAFWAITQQYQLEIKDNSYEIITLITDSNNKLDEIFNQLSGFFRSWSEYYISNELFAEKFTNSEIDEIRRAEKDESNKAIYALAEVLTNGDDKLLDPTLQTNALLAQILLVVQSIMNQNSTPGSLSIADTLQALATGAFKLT